jgi:hypothetical protein
MKQGDITPPAPGSARRTACEPAPGKPAAGQAGAGAALEGAAPLVAPAAETSARVPARRAGAHALATPAAEAPPGRMKRDRAHDPSPAAAEFDADRGEQTSRCDIQGAIPFEVPDRHDRDSVPSRRRAMPARSEAVEIDDPPQAGPDEPGRANGIEGIDDRTTYLGMVAAPGAATLRSPRLVKTPGVPKVRSKSRADGERRRDGACDGARCPDCGGVDCYCHRRPDAV